MALYTTLASLSQTAGSNAADGAIDAPSTIDQQTNLLASFIAQLRDGNGFTVGVNRVANCRVTKSGSNLLLSRYNGDGLTINGVVYSIPSGGVTLAIGTAAASTTYNIYAYMSGSTMTLEFSATAYTTDTATGMPIKTGDATRTLVSMARTAAGTAAWVDTEAQRYVISYFNRRDLKTANNFSTTPTTTSVTYTELNSAVRSEFLAWGDEALMFAISGAVSNSAAGAQTYTAMGLDSTTVAQEGFNAASNPAGINNQLLPLSFTSLIEPSAGYHYASVLGLVSTGTGSWSGSSTAGTRTSIQGLVRG